MDNPDKNKRWAELGHKAVEGAANVVGAAADVVDKVGIEQVGLTTLGFNVALAALYEPADLANMLWEDGIAKKFTVGADKDEVVGVAVKLKDRQIIYTLASGAVDRKTGEIIGEVDGDDLRTVAEVLGKHFYQHTGHAYIPGKDDLETEKPFMVGEDETESVYQFNRQGRLFKLAEAGTDKAHWEETKDFDGYVAFERANALAPSTVEKMNLPGLPIGEKARGLVNKTGISQGEMVVGGGLLALGAVFGVIAPAFKAAVSGAPGAEPYKESFWDKTKRVGGQVLLAAGALLGLSQFVYSVGLKDKLTEKNGYEKPDSVLEFLHDSLERMANKTVPTRSSEVGLG